MSAYNPFQQTVPRSLRNLSKGALSVGNGQIYLVVYEYYVGSYKANRS